MIWIVVAIASSYWVYTKVPFRLIGPRIPYDPDNPRNPTSVKASGLIYTKQGLKEILCCLLAPLIPKITLRDGQIIFLAQKFDSAVFNFWFLLVNGESSSFFAKSKVFQLNNVQVSNKDVESIANLIYFKREYNSNKLERSYWPDTVSCNIDCINKEHNFIHYPRNWIIFL